MKLGFIGLGKMGSRMVKRLVADGHEVLVWNRTSEVVTILQQELPQIDSVATIQELVQRLPVPRVIWTMLPAGEATEGILTELLDLVAPEDVVIDGGNAKFSDTQTRFELFEKKGVKFLGIGVSGGVHAERNGYALMVGGNRTGFEIIRPILETLAAPRADFSYFGTGGAGHFVKMVHNAIEYGMMQAMGEGFEILEKAPYNLNLLQAAKMWEKGTIISSFLMDCAVDALSKDEKLTSIVGDIDATGEAAWALEQARKENIQTPVIEESLAFRKKSKTSKTIQKSMTGKMVAALRHEFGGHKVETKA